MEKRTALITGATSGFGLATARRLAAKGFRLVLTGRRRDRLEEIRRELTGEYPTDATVLCFDIRSRQETESAVGSLTGPFAEIDVLVNNAGLAAGLEPIQDGNVEDWEQMIDTNVKGLLYISRIIGRQMAERRRGHIVNIGSISGRNVYANGAVYCATKHAVHALSEGMRIDLLPYGIKVSEVRPGMADTEFSTVRFHGDRERADRVYEGLTPLSADDIAAAVEWLVGLPPHVNVNDLEIMPLAQANAYYTHREEA